jgi:hypothetical protein
MKTLFKILIVLIIALFVIDYFHPDGKIFHKAGKVGKTIIKEAPAKIGKAYNEVKEGVQDSTK